MSNKTKKAPVQEFSKQRRLLSFSWHGQRFLQYSMIFCDSMFSSLITSMLQKKYCSRYHPARLLLPKFCHAISDLLAPAKRQLDYPLAGGWFI